MRNIQKPSLKSLTTNEVQMVTGGSWKDTFEDVVNTAKKLEMPLKNLHIRQKIML